MAVARTSWSRCRRWSARRRRRGGCPHSTIMNHNKNPMISTCIYTYLQPRRCFTNATCPAWHFLPSLPSLCFFCCWWWWCRPGRPKITDIISLELAPGRVWTSRESRFACPASLSLRRNPRERAARDSCEDLQRLVTYARLSCCTKTEEEANIRTRTSTRHESTRRWPRTSRPRRTCAC